MNDTIDTLKIKVEGEGQSAVKTLDEVISTLSRIKNTTASRSIGTLTSKLESLKTSINNIKTKNLSKLNAIFSTLSKTNKINISPRLSERIRELGEAVNTLDRVDFSKLNEMASGLSALSRVGHVNIPRINGGQQESGSVDTATGLNGTEELSERVVSDNGLSRTQKFSTKLSEIKDKIKSGASKVKSFGSAVKSAFSDTPIGKFIKKIKEAGSSLVRIAAYRIARSLIKQVTDAFSTGIEDMYQYSKTFNGNFARSMDTAASSLLSFKNSIGAVVAPIINLLVPWLDKVVDKLFEINNTAAMVLAGLTGKSTYSKAVRVTTEYADAADKASDNTEKVKNKVEELKRSLAGLDEITIIGNNISPISSAAGGNDSVTDGVDYGSMFVETPVDMAKVNEIKDKFEKILEVAKWIGITIAAWKLASFIGSIAEALTGLDFLKSKMIGLTLMVVGFSLEFSGGYHVGYGDADVWDYIKLALGSALSIAGSLLVFGTGPLGWTIGITAALMVAIASISIGMNARLSDVVEQAFYDAGGTITISDLADQFERYCQAIVNANQPTIDAGNRLRDLRENQIGPTISEINGIITGIKEGALSAEDNLPKIQKAFEDLYDNTKGTWDDMYLAIVQSLAGGFGDTLTALGLDVPVLTGLLSSTTASVKEELDQIMDKFSELYSKLDDGTISFDEWEDSTSELLKRFGEINGISDPVKDSFNKMEEAIDKVDWQNKEKSELAFTKIKESAEEGVAAAEEGCRNLKLALEQYRDAAEDEDTKIKFSRMIAGTDVYRDKQIKDINDKANEVYNQVQDSLIADMQSVTDAVEKEYEDAGWWTKLFHTKDSYVAQGLLNYKENTINPIMDEMKNMYAELGIEGEGYASQAAQEVINGLFNHTGTATTGGSFLSLFGYYNRNTTSSTGMSMEDAVRSAYEEVGQELPNGLIKGIKDNRDKAIVAVGNLASDMNDETKKVSGVNSPSKVYAEIMKFNLLGLIKGIDDNKVTVMNSLDSFLNTMLNRLETFTNRWRSAINSMFDDMAYAWRSADFRSDGGYSYNRLSMGQIQRFAQGGFPEDGLFYANHNELVGQFSNGKTAVANNEQIVEGIAGGVAAANGEQNALLREQNKLLRQLLEKDSTIDVTTIASAFNRKNQRDGKVTVPVSL